MKWLVGSVAVMLGMTACWGAELSCSLTSLQLGKREIEYGTVIEVLADVGDDDHWWHRGNASDAIKMRLREIEGVKPGSGNPAWVYAFGPMSEVLEKGRRYRMSGALREAVAFGGQTHFTLEVAEVTDLGRGVEAATDPRMIDLWTKVGEDVTIVGTLWSLNGVWWLSYGGNVYVTEKTGRSLTFPTEWHGRQVTVSGLVRKQLRASLDQISLKSARDLVMYPVILGAKVELVQREEAAHGEDRFSYLYQSSPKKSDGVFDLLAEPPFRRNIMGNETGAGGYVWRNWPYLRDIVAHRSPETLDVVAKRMRDGKRDRAMRFVYAGILAACDDERGREFLAKALMDVPKIDRDALLVLGDFAGWSKEKPDTRWAEPVALHCLRVAPRETVVFSDVHKLLAAMRSRAGVDLMVDLLCDPENPMADREGRFLFDDTRRDLLCAVLFDAKGLVDVETLERLSKAFSEDEGSRRWIASVLLERDEPVVVDLFLKEIASDGFMSMKFRDHMGPKVRGELEKRLPKLLGDLRFEVEMLLIHHSKDAVDRFVRRLEDPGTPLKEFNHLRWELEYEEGGERGAPVVARFLEERVLKDKKQSVVGAFAVDAAITMIGRSHEKEAVAAMIRLLEADFSGVASEFVSVPEFRNHVAGQLAEMTAVSFGVDSVAWKSWFAKRWP